MIRQKGVQVDILEDPEGIALFAKYIKEKPDQHLEDAYGLAAVRKAARGQNLVASGTVFKAHSLFGSRTSPERRVRGLLRASRIQVGVKGPEPSTATS